MPSSVGEIITLEPGWDEEDTTEGIVNEQKDLTIETLNEDAIEHVITKLDQQDLCNFSQASKPIKAKTSRPKYWQLIKVSKTKIRQEGLPKLFLIEKFNQVQRIDLSDMNFTDQELIVNLRAIADSSVVELDLEGVRVDKVPTDLLAKLARQLTKISLSRSDPTTDQCVALLQACVHPATMTHVNLEWCDILREVPVNLLVNALGHLVQINLNHTYLARQQYLAVVEMCASSPSLVELSLVQADLTDVPPQTLGQAARRLIKIKLEWCHLTSVQCIEVLNACASSPSLVELSLAMAELRDVPPQTLGLAARSLTKIDLSWCHLTSVQCSEILTACASSPLVDISLGSADFSDVRPQILEQAARSLTKIDLSYCDLTTDKCISVLNACIASTTLNHVDMSGNNLQQVPAEQLANAVGNLEIVELMETNLTTEQYTAVLEKCKFSNLTDVDLSGADLRQVSPQLLEEAIRNLQRMQLEDAKVTTEQRIGILNAVFTSSVTVHMYFRGYEKASLPDGLFIQAEGTGRLLVH